MFGATFFLEGIQPLEIAPELRAFLAARPTAWLEGVDAGATHVFGTWLGTAWTVDNPWITRGKALKSHGTAPKSHGLPVDRVYLRVPLK